MNRREFPRVNAPVLCRPVGKPLFRRQKPADVSLGGLRLLADEPPTPGDRLELELLLPGGAEITCTVEVVWTDDLPEGSGARHEVGVKFVQIRPEDRARLLATLEEPPPPAPAR